MLKASSGNIINVAGLTSATNNPSGWSVASNSGGSYVTAPTTTYTSQGGVVTIDSSGSATYTPASTFVGNDTFYVKASNGGGSSSPGLITVTVLPPPTINNASPNTGPLSGGTTVTLTGTNLSGATAVKFGATAATSFTVNSATSITAMAPAHAAGTVDVTVTTSNGTSATSAADQFTYVAAPTIIHVGPSAGPTAGGTTVILVGTNFTGATAVNFGGSAATAFTVDSATTITATAPAGAAGTVDITVTAPGGTSATSAADQFTYIAAPTITTANPGAGPSAGGTTVTLTGTHLSGALAVQFGATSATSFTVNSATTITATAPAHTVGTVDVTVTTRGGTSATSPADQFTYAAAPTISHVSPSAGSTAGGTTVTLTGTNFTGATSASFGGSAATSFTVNSPTTITATAPAGAAGTVDITVTAPGGTSATSAADQFTYVAPPVASSFTYGTNVPYNTGAAAPTSIDVSPHATNSPTSYAVGSATTAQGGSVSINSSGTASYTPPAGFRGNDSFTYTASNAGGASSPATVTVSVGNPTITVTPTTLTAGSYGSGYSQILTASGGHAPYTFSTTPASGSLPPGLSLSASGAISGTPTATGSFNFTVTGTDSSVGTGPATYTSSTISLTVNAVVPGAPAITSVTPGDGQVTVAYTAPSSNGGSTIVNYTTTSNPGALTGTCAASPCTVTGLTNGTAYTFTVTATNGVGTGTASPASSSVTPKASQAITFNNPGAQTYGTSPTLTASASSGQTVSFTSATPAVCTITTGGTLTFLTIGNCSIDADQAGSAAFAPAPQVQQTFVVNPSAESVSSIAPSNGPTAGGTGVTITGSGFISGHSYTASFGGSTVAATYASATTLSATTPSGSAGAVSVTVTDTTFSTAATGSASFTYQAPAASLTVSAPSIATAGTAFSITVTAKDSGGATAPGYTGTIHFTATDAQAGLPADYTFLASDAGVHTFSNAVTLKTAGAQTVTATDSVSGAVHGTSGSVTVSAAAAAHLTATSGTPQSATVSSAFTAPLLATVTDAYSNPVSGVSVVFTAPASGASGTFSNSTNTIAVATGASGQASSGTFTANAAPGGPYNVTGAVSGLTSVSYSLTNAGVAPVITTNPSSQNVVAGSTASFTAAASGAPTPTVQWRQSIDGGATYSNLSGATSTTLSFTTTTAQTGYKYQAVFSNAAGTAATSAATLTVSPAAPTAISTTVTTASVAYGSSNNALSLASDFSGTITGYGVVSTTTSGGGAVSINSSGVASYTPKAGYRGNDTFQLYATNTGVNSATVTATVPVGDPTLSAVLTGTGATRGTSLTGYSITPSGGQGPYGCGLHAGSSAPSGVTIGADCTLSGTPTTSGPQTFAVDIVDSSVTGANGGMPAAYTRSNVPLTLSVASASVSSLSGLSLSAGALSPAFVSGTTSYAASVGNAVSSITVTPTTTDPNATVKVNGTAVASGTASGPIALAVGANTITTVVTAQDGTTTATYTVIVTRAAASTASLSGLSLSSGTLSPAFASGTASYTASVGNGTASLTLTPTTTDPNASVKVNGTTVASGAASGSIPLAVGPNTITTVVTAQDGTTTATYTVTVTRAAASTASLSNLTLSAGTLSPAFASGTTSYTASVGNGAASITLTPTTTDANASVKVNGTTVASGTASGPIALAVGPNTITTVVTAQDGTTNATYTVTVTRAAASNASLSNLTLSAGTLSPAFAGGTTSYTASVGNGAASITLTPTTTDPNASVKVNGTTVASGAASGSIPLAVGANTITTVVTAQDGTTTATYTVTVTRAAASTASLSSLALSAGTLSPAFASGTTSYTASVSNGTTSLTLTPTTTDANASVKVNGTTMASGTASGPIALSVGPNTITTVVTAQDGTTTATYTVTVTRAAASNASLSNLTLSAGTLSPAFASGTTSYAASVGNGTASLTLTPTTTDANASVKVNGNTVASGAASGPIALAVGPNTITTVVTAQDGTTTSTYTVTLTRAAPAPVASATAVTIGSSPSSGGVVGPTSIDLSSSVANATGITVVTPPQHGTVTLTGLTATYTPTTGYFGNDGFTYAAVSGVSGALSPAALVSIAITAPTVSIQQTALPQAQAASAYSQTLSASGGTAPYTFALASGALPTGLTLSPTGVISGVPTAAGTFAFTVKATDSSTGTGPFSVTQSFTLVLAPLTPTAPNLTVSVAADKTGTATITDGAANGPFTGGAVVSIAPAGAGTASIALTSGTVGVNATYAMTFTPTLHFSGAAVVTYTLSNAYTASAPATVTFQVAARPDPTVDPDVKGLVQAQHDTAIRFAESQIANFNQRLEALHTPGPAQSHNGITFQLGDGAEQAGPDDSPERNWDKRGLPRYFGARDVLDRPTASDVTAQAQPNPRGGLAARQAGALGGDADGDRSSGRDGGDRLALWSGGAIDFGLHRSGATRSGLKFNTSGISIGGDYRVSDKLVLGLGGGYGQDKTRIGGDGSQDKATAYTGAVYGSWHPSEKTFLDGVIGYAQLRYDTRRYVASVPEFEFGKRTGDEWFGSLTAGWEMRQAHGLIAPYGRIDAIQGTLDPFSERGGIGALSFGSDTVRSLKSTLGLRGDYAYVAGRWIWQPRFRVEYQHEFQDPTAFALQYADWLNGPTYRGILDGLGRDQLVVGLGADIHTKALNFSLDYKTNATRSTQTTNEIVGKATWKF